MSERVLVTSALPYANGPIHLGHLVEYIQTDVYVRYLRACGLHATYVCAADSHGTPIEVNAAKEGISPKEFVERYRREQHEDFKQFGVDFSIYYTTDSPENDAWAHRIYFALKEKGLIYKKSLEQFYCEKDARFLPDRFVKGTCPTCAAPEQYGDNCEKCGTTYDSFELKDPACALCGTAPVVKHSDHAFVNLQTPEVAGVIRSWVEGEGHLESSARNKVVNEWLADLKDWCITRDAPYFGFPLRDPEFPGKFLYVWMDAPIGYLASAQRYFETEGPDAEMMSVDAFEARYLMAASAEARGNRLEHFIGKDILRFHAVFWPAMLWAAGVKTPDRMAVHGHLVVNGEKMSKSRGTFITARTYLDAGLAPEFLRYFYAANLGPEIADIDMSLTEFENRVNADLSKNIANLASRIKKADIAAAGVAVDQEIANAVREALSGARAAYQALRFRDVVRHLTAAATVCNRRLQETEPWKNPSGDAERSVLYSTAKALSGLALILSPVMPLFASKLAASLGQSELPVWTEGYDPFDGTPASSLVDPPMVMRLDPVQIAKLIVPAEGVGAPEPPVPAKKEKGKKEKTMTDATKADTPVAIGTPTPAEATPAPAFGVITYDDFAKVELRVGLILSAEAVPKADKLLKLSVDVGEAEPRTIAAGIALAYPDPQELVGKRIVVVANLSPRPLRGIVSQGMLLAAGEPPLLQVVTVGDAIAPGTRVK